MDQPVSTPPQGSFPALLAQPFRVLLTGLSALLVLALGQQAGLPGLVQLLEAVGKFPAILAAVLVFLVGLAFAGFLWWLAARSFALLRDPRTTPEQLASLRDLPMALPEGTVRAVLALIVGVVGLPLLLFSQTLGLRDAVSGYVNGIIAGVFGYYFGARGGAGDAQVARRATDALATATHANEALRGEAATATQRAALPGQVAQAMDSLSRHIGIAETVVETLGPALPAGVLPANAAALLQQARDAAKAAGGLAEGDASPATLDMLQRALCGLTGAGGPFAALLRAASTALPVMGGPLGAGALLLGLGWQAGAAAWRRWRAQVLAAPHDPTLFDAGGITPTSAALRLAEVPALAPLAEQPAMLLDLALREDGPHRLWAEHGEAFASPEAAEAALLDFRRVLLAERAGADITAPALEALSAALNQAAPALRPATPDTAAAAALLAAAGAQPNAAVQALALLTAQMRERKLDAPRALQELTP